MEEEKLYLDLMVSEEAVSAALIREEKRVQLPVYYMSKRLHDTETWYHELDKLVLALIIASRKLRPYLQAHSIEVLMNYPLRQVLQKPETLGRFLKWAIEFSQFNISYKPRSSFGKLYCGIYLCRDNQTS